MDMLLFWKEEAEVWESVGTELYCGEICKSLCMAIICPVRECNFSYHGCLCADYKTEKVFPILKSA